MPCKAKLIWEIAIAYIRAEDIFFMDKELSDFKGGMTENYVITQLAANGFKPFFWRNEKRTNEVDFIISLNGKLIPIEVKSGDNVTSESLKEYVKRHEPAYAIRLSTRNFGFENNINPFRFTQSFVSGTLSNGTCEWKIRCFDTSKRKAGSIEIDRCSRGLLQLQRSFIFKAPIHCSSSTKKLPDGADQMLKKDRWAFSHERLSRRLHDTQDGRPRWCGGSKGHFYYPLAAPACLRPQRNYEPQELVHVSGNTYCTREHDSLRISNGKWYWFSQDIGGRSALDYLIKAKGLSFM